MRKPRGRRVEIRGFLPPFLVLISSLRQGVLTAGSRDKTSPLIPEDLDRGLGDRLARFSRHTTASTSGQKECRERRRDARRTGEQEEATEIATRLATASSPLLSPRLMIYVIMNHVYL